MSDLIRLENRSVIEISGEEASDFLQGILTNDINGTQDGHAIYAGLLTPQGKLLFDFFIVRHKDSFLVDVEKTQTDDLIKRLMFYKLRAKVDLRIHEETIVCANLDGTSPSSPNNLCYIDPRTDKMGSRILSLTGQVADCAAEPDKWLAHRIRHGIPQAGADYTHTNCFPHDIAMDQLNGIGFKKGCYVGQEVVSRMQHRGTARKRPMIIKARETLPAAPADIRADGAMIGRLGSQTGSHGLAEIRLDRAIKAKSDHKSFEVDGIEIELLRPAWAQYGEEFECAD